VKVDKLILRGVVHNFEVYMKESLRKTVEIKEVMGVKARECRARKGTD
jgi:hypothetical protein